MLKLLTRWREQLDDFVEQREHLLLVVCCRDEEGAFLLKLLDELDQASDEDLYVSFAIPFRAPDSYVDQLVDDLAQRHALASAALEEAGKPALPPLPESLRDVRRSAQERLRTLLGVARGLLPEDARRLVFTLAPMEIHDREAYLRLVTAITPQPAIESWMPRVRVVLRDLPWPAPTPHPLLALAPTRSRTMTLDMSTDAIARDLDETASDETEPMEARAQALFSLALIDVAAARSELAVERLTSLLSYYQSTNNLVMQGMVLNALGDTFTRIGDPRRALEWYEMALVPAAESKNPILLSTLARNVGNTEFALERFNEAHAYYAQLDRVATHLLDAETKSAALYAQGLCSSRLRDVQAAIERFEAGATLCRGTDQHRELDRHLEQLRALYAELGWTGKALLIDEERARLGGRPS